MRFIYLCVFLTIPTVHCAKKTNCRKYATAIAPSTGAQINCKFDQKSAQNRCTSGNINSVYAYTGIDQFIDEGHAMGRQRWETLLISGGTSQRTDTFYSADKRILSIVTTSGSVTTASTALEWDSIQRTTKYLSDYDSGTGSTCKGKLESAQFDDASHKVSGQISLAQSVGTGTYAGTPCAGSADSTFSYNYDSDNLMISSISTTYAILSKEEICQ